MMVTNFQELARILSDRLWNGVVEGLVIALFAWALLRIVGRCNSSTRFAVWFCALLVLAASPFLGGMIARAYPARTDAVVSAIRVPESWAIDFVLLWAAVASLGVIRMVVGVWQVRKLRVGSRTVDLEALDPALRKTLQESGSSRKVTLAVSENLPVPTAIGFLRPMILLPAWTMQELSTAELHSILIHELAHLQRWDDWTNLAQKFLRSLLFFHPAVWWIDNQLALEREMACDDVVLAHTANAAAYAECLIAIAEKSFLRRGLALAQAAVSRMRQTSLRVAQILDGSRPRATGVWKPALGLLSVFSAIGVIGLSRAPQLVAFQDTVPRTLVASAPAANSPVVRDEGTNQPARAMLASLRTKSPAPRGARAAIVRHRGAAGSGLASSIETRLIGPPAVVETAFAGSAPNGLSTAMILVVLRTQTDGAPGPPLWTVYVWRVSFPNAAPISPGAAILAKSI